LPGPKEEAKDTEQTYKSKYGRGKRAPPEPLEQPFKRQKTDKTATFSLTKRHPHENAVTSACFLLNQDLVAVAVKGIGLLIHKIDTFDV
jgi:hypothetical protein